MRRRMHNLRTILYALNGLTRKKGIPGVGETHEQVQLVRNNSVGDPAAREHVRLEYALLMLAEAKDT